MTDLDAPKVQRAEELLLAMKDNSDLMVDLAYTSIFYNSKRIAEEVSHLEDELGANLTELQQTALQAVRDGELDIPHAMVLIRIAQAAEAIANSALEIADLVLREVDLHPVLADAIQESDSAITKVELLPESTFTDQTLASIALETETGMRVLAVRRGGRWRTKVAGSFRLRAGDLLVAAGPPEAIEPFQVACGQEPS